MNTPDDDLRDAFQALRTEDAHTAPPFGRVTRPIPAPPRRAWLRWALAPAAAVIAIVLLVRRPGHDLPDAEVVRLAGTWRSPTDFLLENRTDELLRHPVALPDLNLRLAPVPPPAVEHDS